MSDLQVPNRILPKPGFSSLLLRNDVFHKAMTLYRQKSKSGELGERKKKKSFSRYVNDIIKDALEEDRILSSASPVLSKVAVEGNSVLIKDSKRNRLAEVKIELSGRRRVRQLTCLLDNRSDCLHVGFAYSIPEVYRMK
jgi:hypothetical protein